ncbi:Hypothetical predicted protein [Mytilus galloprovincialis]|uniref:Innexin n=1 Tax=Mytilus galloprovincialis TaxID=29158 RepID=A0A8B6GUT4_MYTGA|nr:Hypothetical predicted protein [Mytilus galloprovincialis]
MIFNFYKPTVNYGSWADRLSSTWTFLLLLILALLTVWRHYRGPNFICKTPPEFPRHWNDFTDESCWLSRQIKTSELYGQGSSSDSVDILEVMDIKDSANEDGTRTLYQWLPLILFLQALLFLLPDVILRICESSFGFGCQKLTKMIQDYRQYSADDRKYFAIEIGSYLHQEFSGRLLRVLPFGILTVLLAFVKLLFFVNAATQLIILEGYLSPQNVTSYGHYVFESIINTNYSTIAYSPVFPREKVEKPYERPPVDSSEDPSKWSKIKLIQELKGMDIEVPVDLSKPIILQLFNSNIKSKRKEATVIENEAEVIPDIGTQQSPPGATPNH